MLPENSPQRRTETDSDGGSCSTEVLGNHNSLPVDRTPILMVSPPTSPDSVDGEVFGTPPEEPSFSASADSCPKSRVPEEENAYASDASKHPSFGAAIRVSEQTPDSASAAADVATQFTSSTAVNVKVSGNQSASATVTATATGKIRVPETETAACGARTGSIEDSLRIPLKDIVEAIVRNSGMTDESSVYEKLTFVDILNMSGVRFPE